MMYIPCFTLDGFHQESRYILAVDCESTFQIFEDAESDCTSFAGFVDVCRSDPFEVRSEAKPGVRIRAHATCKELKRIFF